MKKTFLAAPLAALMILTASSYSDERGGTRPGDFAPRFEVGNASAKVDLGQLRGQYVLLTFWSSADAPSRIEAGKYAAWMGDNANANVRHISVNFDDEPALFAEIAKRDGLDLMAQYNVAGAEAEKIISDYGLDKGYGTMLIGPDGRIAKLNPTASDLSSL